MNSFIRNSFLCLSAAPFLITVAGRSQDVPASPCRGGGLNTNSPMIHVDIFYDSGSNVLQATLDTTKPTPHLVPLPAGFAFDSRSNYYVLSGKAYNFQYAWNPGGTFALPAGAALWIECLSVTPGLECYDGPGNKMLTTPRSYAPIFGTAGSSTKWKWYNAMAHNSYAVVAPTNSSYSAQYRVYFGDEQTGARDAYLNYPDATVTLTWLFELAGPPVLRFGATDEANQAPLCLLEADSVVTNSSAVINLDCSNNTPVEYPYSCSLPMMALPATSANGGPATNHAGVGARLELQLVSLAGPQGGVLAAFEPGETQPSARLFVGDNSGTNTLILSENDGTADADPYGSLQGRRVVVNKAGLFCLGVKVVDTSTNGPAGGPIHSCSPLYQLYLQAGLVVNSVNLAGSAASVGFGGAAGKTFYLERAVSVQPGATWQKVGGPLTGSAHLQSLTDSSAVADRNFYRLRSTTP